jgi:tetrapyrrole methylase family protein / MazG family protein
MPAHYPTIPAKEFNAFVSIVRRLRKECPWDREQTHQSIRHSLIEETYEVVEALDTENLDELRKELGDLLLHVVMHATIAEQAKEFSLKDVVDGISDKLIRRHPHVFGKQKAGDAQQVISTWEKLKLAEGRTSVLEGVPKHLPALQRAMRVQERVARVGFDWKRSEDAWKKVEEEVGELKRTLKSRNKKRREEEFGDFIFALVNYARFIDVNPENALRSTIEKFIRRFHYIEAALKKAGKDVHDSSLEEMDKYWEEAKRKKV